MHAKIMVKDATLETRVCRAVPCTEDSFKLKGLAAAADGWGKVKADGARTDAASTPLVDGAPSSPPVASPWSATLRDDLVPETRVTLTPLPSSDTCRHAYSSHLHDQIP
jgi:hypothetical protein